MEVRGRDGAGEDRRHRGDDPVEDRLDVVRAGERLREPEQGRRGLGRFAFELEQSGVLEGDGGMRRQHLEEPLVLLVELVVPLVGEDDDADAPVAVVQRDGEDRRLFYVALTRVALKLYVPYFQGKKGG